MNVAWQDRDWQVRDRHDQNWRDDDWRDHGRRDDGWRDQGRRDQVWRGQDRHDQSDSHQDYSHQDYSRQDWHDQDRYDHDQYDEDQYDQDWQDQDWHDADRTFGRSASAMRRVSGRSWPGPRTSWAIAGVAFCLLLVVAVQAWGMLTSAAQRSQGDVVGSIARSARPAASAQAPRPRAPVTNAARKGDRLGPLAATPGGETWDYLLNDTIVSHFAEIPVLASTARFEDIAGRSDAPVFIRPRVASLTSNPFLDLASVRSGKTDLIGFNSSAFPYHGVNPRTQGGSFDGQRYSDNSVLLHVPTGFNPRKPGVIVVFFHGHGATLARDVRDRQLLPRQISDSGVNAVLVAPQLAYDAADSSAGKFWERNGLKRFLDEAAVKLAKLTGDPSAKAAFDRMPVVLVGYSGGFVATAWSLQVGGAGNRIRGVLLMDALYGEMDKFNSWIMNHRSAFFVSAYTHYTKYRDDDFARRLNQEGIQTINELDGPLKPGTVAFLETSGLTHRDFVTRAWTSNPISDMLVRMAQR